MSTTSSLDPSTNTADPASTPFEQLGGEVRVRELVDRFYDLMDLDQDFQALRATHGESLDSAREKLFWFLCGWLGGPNYYVERFGHPRLRMRHLPFSIGDQERDQWVCCMGRAMQDINVPAALQDRLLTSFYNTADWMRNRV